MDPEITVIQFETEEIMSNLISGEIPDTGEIPDIDEF